MSRERFRKVYSVLPEAERNLTVVAIDKKSITWKKAFDEIMKDTNLGKRIQKRLEQLKLI